MWVLVPSLIIQHDIIMLIQGKQYIQEKHEITLYFLDFYSRCRKISVLDGNYRNVLGRQTIVWEDQPHSFGKWCHQTGQQLLLLTSIICVARIALDDGRMHKFVCTNLHKCTNAQILCTTHVNGHTKQFYGKGKDPLMPRSRIQTRSWIVRCCIFC